jgi:hypothetical protein
MKRLTITLTSVLCLLLVSCFVRAQPRDAGRLVVPEGYEQYDSIRFAPGGVEFLRQGMTWIKHGDYFHPSKELIELTNRMLDTLMGTFEFGFGDQYGNDLLGSNTISSKRKGVASRMDGFYSEGFSLTRIAGQNKARTFYPSPNPRGEDFYFAHANTWRYNDINFNPQASWHDNAYDTNDISPYCEYPQNDSFVRMSFHSSRYGTRSGDDSLVYADDEGRVILGCSDNRAADELLRVNPNTTFPFQDSLGHIHIDTAKTFSLNLDFNIDESSIDTVGVGNRRREQLPLLILQALFKEGADSTQSFPGWPVSPFLPFRDAEHPNNPGWYKVLEVVVTKRVYDSLIAAGEYSWKSEDTLQNGLPAHSWRFVQLHRILTDVPESMRALMKVNRGDADFAEWGQGSGLSAITTLQTPDSAIADAQLREKPLLELRILSTYRATVRIRGLDFHDTTLDKYLYRKRIPGSLTSTHSCNPDGSIGGYDDSVNAHLAAQFDHAPFTSEFLFNDTYYYEAGASSALSVPMLAYLDYLGAKHNVHAHWREQDDGRNARQYRRFRMVFDCRPPSMFENQFDFFGGNLFAGSFEKSGCVVFPEDYLYYSHLDPPNVAWPSHNDTIVGLITARRALVDPTGAYRAYESETARFADYCGKLRGSQRVALDHPNNKRFAIGADLQGWGICNFKLLTVDKTKHQYHFDRRKGYGLDRPTTPEEIMGLGFAMLAEGISSFNSAQAFNRDLAPGVCGLAPRTRAARDSASITHGYNIGHIYTWLDTNEWTNPDTSDLCGDLPPFYVGYSNSWRAYIRLLTRMNEIYDSTNGRKCPHPYKYMTWQDAYSNNRAEHDTYGYGDRASKDRAFLKIVETRAVKRYTRGPDGSFLDSSAVDDPNDARVEVGMFKDSISATLINRAAIIVNTRFWPSLVDSVDLRYYNSGMDSLSMCHTTLGDIDSRKITMLIDTSQLPQSFRYSRYLIRDLWHPDIEWQAPANAPFSIYLKPGDAKFLYIEKGL